MSTSTSSFDLNNLDNHSTRAGVHSSQGSRSSQEDGYVIWQGRHPNAGSVSIFAVLDGHTGTISMNQCRNHLVYELMSHLGWKAAVPLVGLIIRDAINALEQRCLIETRHSKSFDGTTLCLVLIYNDSLYTANVGDSRAFLIRRPNSQPTQRLTDDHKLSNPAEFHRLQASAASMNRNRLLGIHKNLSVSRALGDRDFKDFDVSMRPNNEPSLIALPDIVRHDLTEWLTYHGPQSRVSDEGPSEGNITADDEECPANSQLDGALVLLATDGLWDIDFFDDEAISQFAIQHFLRTASLSDTAARVIEEAQRYRANDNCTLIVIRVCCRRHLRRCKLPEVESGPIRLPIGVISDYWHLSPNLHTDIKSELSKLWQSVLRITFPPAWQ